MTRGLLCIPFLCFLFLMTSTTTFAQNNHLQYLITKTNKDLNIVVVDAEGFTAQDNVQPNGGKERYHTNLEWFKDNWYTFSKSVREGKSYRIVIDHVKFKSLTAAEKAKLEELYITCSTGRFDPVGLANAQASKIKYGKKGNGTNEQAYMKEQLTEQFMNNHAQSQRAVVLVLNKQVAAQIQSILTN